MKKHLLTLSCAIATFAVAGSAQAATTFVGIDDGSAIGGPRPVSDAAKSSFLAAASVYGPTRTETFETIAAAGTGFSHAGLSGTLDAGNFGNGFSGVSDTTFGNLYGFDTTTGSASGHWFGFPSGSTTLTFASPTNSLGFFLTGLQTSFGGELTLTQLDGSQQVFNLASLIAQNGGTGFFGVVDSTSFTSATLSRPGNDAWGIDDVVFNAVGVPEPSTWALMILGFGFIGGALRRRQSPKVGYAF